MKEIQDTHIEMVLERMHGLKQAFSLQQEDAWIHSDLTLGQIKAFFVIAKDGNPSVGLIAKELNVGLSSASQVVDQLVRAGLVERSSHPEDRRVTQCVLSLKGQDLRTSAEAGSDMLRTWLKRMSEDELAALQQGLTGLLKAASHHESGKNGGENKYGSE